MSDNRTVSAGRIAPDLRSLAVPINILQPAPDNVRAHRDFDINAIAESLARGQQKPIVAKREYRGLTNVVIAGNGTWLAARRLGWSDIAVAWFEGTDDQAREFAIRDNRVAELSRWDVDALSSLQADGVDLLSLWHDDAALADLMQSLAPVPRFEPLATNSHRLDMLANDTTCPACGHSWHRGTPR